MTIIKVDNYFKFSKKVKLKKKKKKKSKQVYQAYLNPTVKLDECSWYEKAISWNYSIICITGLCFISGK